MLHQAIAIYKLPRHDDLRYAYPVAEYDHDEGNSISGGFVYNGNIPLLKGKYVFWDIFRGRVFLCGECRSEMKLTNIAGGGKAVKDYFAGK